MHASFSAEVCLEALALAIDGPIYVSLVEGQLVKWQVVADSKPPGS